MVAEHLLVSLRASKFFPAPPLEFQTLTLKWLLRHMWAEELGEKSCVCACACVCDGVLPCCLSCSPTCEFKLFAHLCLSRSWDYRHESPESSWNMLFRKEEKTFCIDKILEQSNTDDHPMRLVRKGCVFQQWKTFSKSNLNK